MLLPCFVVLSLDFHLKNITLTDFCSRCERSFEKKVLTSLCVLVFVSRVLLPVLLFSDTVMTVDSLPSANNISFLALEPFSILRLRVPLTISAGRYSVFSRLISKVKSVPFGIFLNIISDHRMSGYQSDDLKITVITQKFP